MFGFYLTYSLLLEYCHKHSGWTAIGFHTYCISTKVNMTVGVGLKSHTL